MCIFFNPASPLEKTDTMFRKTNVLEICATNKMLANSVSFVILY